jgi:hypothetical protein
MMRLGLAVLVASNLVPGAWAALAPRSFYDDFPGLGHTWVALLPPYNEHLLTDVGAYGLALALLLGWAAVTLQPTLVRAALASYLVFTLPHFVFHLTQLDGFPRSEAIAQTASLALQVALPMALLIAALRAPARRGPLLPQGR